MYEVLIWQCVDIVIGSVHNTTGSNVSPTVGTVMRLERKLGEELLKLPCRRHIMELHAKHFAKAASKRPSTSPADVLFKRLHQSKWPGMHESIKMDELNKYDWAGNVGSYLNERASEMYALCCRRLEESVFPRGDYQEYCELCFV